MGQYLNSDILPMFFQLGPATRELGLQVWGRLWFM